jgi:glycosyltransferase involved in cell wall biosynthesis
MSPRRVRILFMPRESFPTDRVRINVLFAQELLGRGHKIDFAMQAARPDVPTGDQAWSGTSIWIGETDGGGGLSARLHKHWLAFRHDLRSLLRARADDYDAVLISDKFLVALLARAVTRARGIRFIFWLTFPVPEMDLHGAQTGTARYPWLSRLRGHVSGWLLYRRLLPSSDHVFVQSERMKHEVCKYGVDPAKVSPIVTGFGLHAIRQRWQPDRLDASVVTVAYLGTLSADRRLDVLVEMLALLRGRGMNVRLLFVGNADRARDRELLEVRGRELGMSEFIEITGALPQAEALERISRADVGLSPILRSPIYDVSSPTKMIEYLALGMPVVANDNPEQQMILRESRAGVCVPWSARNFARGVEWLSRRSLEERIAMGARGRAWVESNRTYSRLADGVERTLCGLLSEPPPEADLRSEGR